MFTFSIGNNKGNYQFLCLTEFDASCDEIQSKNAGVVQKFTDDMPKYHSHSVKQQFGRMVDVKLLIYVKCIGS